MNKVAQMLLAAAIAIVFPALATYAAITLIPNPPFTESPPAYPAPLYTPQPVCTTDVDAGNTVITKNAAQSVVNNCIQQRANYDQQLHAEQQKQTDYEAAQKAYDAREQAATAHSQLIIIYRSVLALAIAFAGIAALLALQSVSTLVYGIASGAGITLIGGISVLLWGGANSHEKLAETMLLGVFALSVAFLLAYEHRFHPPSAPEAALGSRSEPEVSKRPDTPKVPDAVEPVVIAPTAPPDAPK